MNVISPKKDFRRNFLFMDKDLLNEHDKSREGLEKELLAYRQGPLEN